MHGVILCLAFELSRLLAPSFLHVALSDSARMS